MKNIVLTLTTRQELTWVVLCVLVHEIHGSLASIRAIFSCKCHWLQINSVYTEYYQKRETLKCHVLCN